MGIYLHLFENETQYQQKRDNDYEEPWVSYIDDIERVDFNISKAEKMREPLTFEILGNGTVSWIMESYPEGYGLEYNIEYSLNGGTWETMYPNSDSVSVVAGDVIQFKADEEFTPDWEDFGVCYAGITGRGSFGHRFETTCDFKVRGNIMSLYNPVYYSGMTEFTSAGGSRAFMGLFEFCTGLTDAGKLVLPVDTLDVYCYSSMFNQCTNLLVAPELNATELAADCYYFMFNDCTSLVTAPVLPATTLAEECYSNMFAGCTNLNNITCLATDISATDCTNYWVYNVASNGTFIKNPSMSSWTTDESGIPNGWTVQDA